MEPLRFEGVIASWNDARGFGFIAPAAGGDPVFVHARAFAAQAPARPQAGMRVSFAVEPGPQGRKRACRVAPVSASPAIAAERSAPRGGSGRSGGNGKGGRSSGPPRSRRRATAAPGRGALWALPAFAVFCAVLGLAGSLPRWTFAVYGGMGLTTFLAYAWDKASAINGGWRTRESSLHLLALAGGWPGALLAQQFLRHKSAKAEFRAVFWMTVVINAAALGVLCSPFGAELRRALAA
ncbi:cold shock and DUF1294 domain-containing protein [Paracidovorax konjaci]|uniref:Uncharacterized membrane protein YsdA, DUF1294 family n=1 Tax=Paracidovorax konjaci TaxID=32040 RepID=A0A1I1ZFF6_9BURK|nr:cold shock and DUF1294 domain-containing protein [Paracidovorax konjaci]SFE30564.1 Uncharacterized membrane protein YsdA, DUF1294 family [Paracidovorax konjaci]